MKRKKRHEQQMAAIASAVSEAIQLAVDCPDVTIEEVIGMLDMFALALKLDMLESMRAIEEE